MLLFNPSCLFELSPHPQSLPVSERGVGTGVGTLQEGNAIPIACVWLLPNEISCHSALPAAVCLGVATKVLVSFASYDN